MSSFLKDHIKIARSFIISSNILKALFTIFLHKGRYVCSFRCLWDVMPSFVRQGDAGVWPGNDLRKWLWRRSAYVTCQKVVIYRQRCRVKTNIIHEDTTCSNANIPEQKRGKYTLRERDTRENHYLLDRTTIQLRKPANIERFGMEFLVYITQNNSNVTVNKSFGNAKTCFHAGST